MSDKMYHQEPFANNFERLQCVQQMEQLNSNQHYLSSSNTSTGNQQTSSNVYDFVYGPQTSFRAQNSCNLFNTCAEQIDTSAWFADPRVVTEIEKGLKLSDKIETIEITSKDLSPVSCCSNVDLLFPDFYKTFGNKDQNCCSKAKDGNQWNSKYVEYPSCAQVGCDEYAYDKTVKYCSIQKPDDYQYNAAEQYLPQYIKNVTDSNQTLLPTCDLYNTNNLLNDSFFTPPQPACPINFNPIDQNTEASNEESDIVVEESDEEVTDYSEDHERRYDYRTNCIICNVLYTPIGNQFYFLTSETPLTMSTQKPVSIILKNLVGMIQNTCNYLCSQCLSLVNTLDHLQMKLESCRKELHEKFRKTCSENGYDSHINRSTKSVLKRSRKQLFNLTFKCKSCKKCFSLKKIYHHHMKRHKNNYLCEYCGKQFLNMRKIRVHLNTHAKKKKKIEKLEPFVCKICSRLFRTRSNLKEHENFCSGLLPYKCKHSNCDKKFATSTKLKNHVKLKHDKKFVAICSICNIGFIKMSDYKTHKTTHSTEKKYACSKCDKMYKTLSNLNFHMKFHSDKLPFNCDVCGKGFMRKDYLETHTNLHKGIKNFNCHVCNKKFAAQKNLDSHLKYHDGSVKRKTCNICGKSLTTGFEEHLRTHSNLKEFECTSCGMRFNTKGALTKHVKNKHKP